MQATNPVVIVLVVAGVLLVGYLIWNSMSAPKPTAVSTTQMEHFVGMADAAPSDQVQVMSGAGANVLPAQPAVAQNVNASESIEFVEQPQGVMQMGTLDVNQLPSECYPKNVLSSADLLPADANTLYAQVNPSGQGSLADQNFLTAGFHIGINTVGQTLRNANRQIRSEPLNPQVKVSPWMQTTIEPDINRKPLEIGGGDL